MSHVLKYLRFENTCSFLQPVSLQWKKCREIRRYGVEFEQHRSLKMFAEFGQRSHQVLWSSAHVFTIFVHLAKSENAVECDNEICVENFLFYANMKSDFFQILFLLISFFMKWRPSAPSNLVYTFESIKRT